MMNCTIFEKKLNSYLLGDLDDLERARVVNHAKQCSSCRKKLDSVESMNRSIVEQFSESTSDFNSRLVGAVKEEIAHTKNKDRGNSRPGWQMAVAAVVLVSIISVFIIDRWLMSSKKGLAKSEQEVIHEIWHQAGVATYQGSHAHRPVVSEGHIYVVKERENKPFLTAINASDGLFAWHADEENYLGYIATDAEKVFIVGESDVNGIALIAYDKKDGTRCWAYYEPYLRHQGALSQPQVCGNKILWSINSDIIAINKKDGSLLWRIDTICPDGNVNFDVAGPKIAITHSRGIALVDSYTGQILSERTLENGLSRFYRPVTKVYGGNLYAGFRTIYGKGILMSFDMKKLQQRWRQGNIAASQIEVSGTVLLVRSRTVRALDTKSGEQLWQSNASGCSPVTVQNNNVYITDVSNDGGLCVRDVYTGTIVANYTIANTCAGIIISKSRGYISTNDGYLRAFVLPSINKKHS